MPNFAAFGRKCTKANRRRGGEHMTRLLQPEKAWWLPWKPSFRFSTGSQPPKATFLSSGDFSGLSGWRRAYSLGGEA